MLSASTCKSAKKRSYRDAQTCTSKPRLWWGFLCECLYKGKYFCILVVKTLMRYLLSEKIDELQQLKRGTKSQISSTMYVDVEALEVYADNLAYTGSFKSFYLGNWCRFIRHKNIDIGRQSVLETGANSQLARVS